MIPTFLPSLQHMASVTISMHIFCNSEIQRMLHTINRIPLDTRRRDNHITFPMWKKIKEAAIQILPPVLPNELKTSIADCIRPMQREIDDWLIDHAYVHDFSSGISSSSYISWKSDGTIDRLQTAKNILRNPDFHFVGRFLMACTYFLEEDILHVWEYMRSIRWRYKGENLVILFWMKWLEQKNNIHWSQMFSEHFVNPTIRPAALSIRVTRIFDFLPQESRSDYVTIIGRLGHKDDIHLCMYQLNEQQRTQLVISDPQAILTAHLRWPLQTMFMEMTNLLWDYMTVEQFCNILMHFLFTYVYTCLEHFDYLRLFKDFWQSSPAFFQEEVRQQEKFEVIEAILNYNKDACTLSFEDAKKYYNIFISKYSRYTRIQDL